MERVLRLGAGARPEASFQFLLHPPLPGLGLVSFKPSSSDGDTDTRCTGVAALLVCWWNLWTQKGPGDKSHMLEKERYHRFHRLDSLSGICRDPPPRPRRSVSKNQPLTFEVAQHAALNPHIGAAAPRWEHVYNLYIWTAAPSVKQSPIIGIDWSVTEMDSEAGSSRREAGFLFSAIVCLQTRTSTLNNYAHMRAHTLHFLPGV